MIKCVIFVIALLLPILSLADFKNCYCPPSYWSLEIAAGAPYNFTTRLHIDQNPEPAINLHAHYETRPFRMPFYHNIRIGKWDNGMAWEFETIHHKIYLKNTTPDVEHFSISHGYNLFYFNRAIMCHSYIWRLGGGFVVTHPESTVRHQTFDEKGGTWNNAGYYLAGASAQASVGKRFYVYNKMFVEIEGRVTASEVRVPIVNGHAVAPNIAVHANLGIGYDF